MRRIAEQYEKGSNGKEKDLVKAYSWYKKAAFSPNGNIKDKLAFHHLALCYQDGIGTEVNFKLAFEHFQMSSKFNDRRSFLHLAWYYINGYSCNSKLRIGLEWLFKIAQCGNTKAMILISNFTRVGLSSFEENDDRYLEKKYIIRDLNISFKIMQKASTIGDIRATRKLSQFYFLGLGIEKDPQKAITCLQSAADKGDIRSLYLLGKYFRNDYLGMEGNWENPELAFKYFQQSAEKDYHKGTFELAKCYLEGYGTNLNFKLAVQNFEKTTTLPYDIQDKLLSKKRIYGQLFFRALSLANIANIYYHNSDFEKSDDEIIQIYAEAINTNRESTMEFVYNVHPSYTDTIFKKINFLYWKQIAKEEEEEEVDTDVDDFSFDTCYELGRLYRNGEGTKQNFQKSYNWYNKLLIKDSLNVNIDVILIMAEFYRNDYGIKDFDFNNILDIAYKTSLFCYVSELSDGTDITYFFRDYHGEKKLNCILEYFENVAREKDKNKDYITAMLHVIEFYKCGYGVEKDLEKAEYWSKAYRSALGISNFPVNKSFNAKKRSYQGSENNNKHLRI